MADDLNSWSISHIEEPIPGSEEPLPALIIDLAIVEVALNQRMPPVVLEDPSSLDEYLVDQLFEEDADLLLSQDDGFGGHP